MSSRVIDGYECFRISLILEDIALGDMPYTHEEIRWAMVHASQCDICENYLESVASRGDDLTNKRMARVLLGAAGLDKEKIILKLRA